MKGGKTRDFNVIEYDAQLFSNARNMPYSGRNKQRKAAMTSL